MALKLEYEIDEPAPGTVYCSLLPVPAIREDGSSQFMDVLERARFTCRSEALDILGILGFSGLVLLGVFVVIGCLHGRRLINVGDWLFPDVEKQRFEGLKKAPFANELGDAHVETTGDEV
jgi:hypothetical protein